MNAQNQPQTNSSRLLKTLAVAVLAITTVDPTVFGASQTWTNAPVSTSWTNINNWVAKAVPGAVNGTGNGANADTATFNSPIVSGIGGAGNPIAPDDATTANTRSRAVLGVTFDTTNCGAYVFASPSPAVLPNTGIPATGILYVGHNGALRINAPVTNTQTFLIPMYVLLPSSTAGIFNLVNNSTNPTASLVVSSITHGGATTRATTYILDGSSSALNVVTNLSEGGGNATGGFTKQGTGTWLIAGPGTFPAASPMNINNGVLAISDAGAFGAASTVTVNSNAQLRVDNSITPTTATFTVQRNGTIKANGSSTINGVTVGTAAPATSPNLVTTSSGDVLTVGNANNKVTGGAADSLIHISGPGKVSLPFDNNYLGKWTVDAGTLAISSVNSLAAGASINIAAGATLDLTAFGAVTYTLTTAALSASGTGTTVGSTAANLTADAGATIDLATGSKGISLTITPTAFSGDTTHPALYISQGTLALGGNAFTINNASGSPLGVGTYRLIQQATGNITDGGGYSVTGVSGSGLVSGNVASVVVSGGNVNLVVAPYTPKNLVWSGTGNVWDIATTANWLNGASAAVFNNSDNVTFNSTGTANPIVTLAGTLSPGAITIDTAANNYTLTGGQIAGGASLLKKSSGTLILGQANTYSGGTVVSNGVLQLAANNAISAIGSGNVSIISPAIVDLNGFNNTINGLNGDGTVDINNGGASTLTVGDNGNSGNFSGNIKNSSGTLGLVKSGTGTQSLSGSNNYAGTTAVNVGSLRAANPYAIGAGASAVSVAVGATLDVATNVLVSSISGVGSIANNSTTTTNKLIVQSTSTFGGSIADGSGGGGLSLLVNGGTLALTAGNTFSGGSIVASGAVLIIGNSGSAGSGGIIASNNTRVGFNNANNPSAFAGNNLTTVDGATVLISGGGNAANNLAFQFFGGVTATNVLTNSCSIGGANSFANFLGTVIVGPSTSARFFNAQGGGDSTTFDFQGGNVFSRDANTIRLGALQGGSASSGIGRPNNAGSAVWIIGNANKDTVFSGSISSDVNLPATNNAIVKSGTGKLVLNGLSVTTNTDSSTYTNYLNVPLITYIGSTVISNGTLAVVAPNNLANSSSIRLAGAGAVLDASQIGLASNYVEAVSGQNVSDIITNGILNLATSVPLNGSPQTLTGIGSILGTLVAGAGTTVTPGLPTGTLTVSSNITLSSANLNVTFNRTNSPNSGQLAAAGAASITVSGGTLNISATGNDLITGDTFQVFNKASIGNFAVTNLPASNALNTVQYIWTNKLSIDGTIVLLQGASAVNTSPTNLISSVSGNVLSLSWPADHTGWKLQIQTNGLSTGLNTNWVTLPGSELVNSTNLTINPANGAVFYRLVYP